MPRDMLRIPESGKFVGDPGLQVGPGSTGLIFRQHGIQSGTSVSIPTATVVAIPGLDLMPVEITPGRKYEIKVDTEVFGKSTTASGTFIPFVRFRNASSSVWGAWLSMNDDNYHTYSTGSISILDAHYVDSVHGWTFTASVDAVSFGVQDMSGASVQTLELQPEACFARVEEYA